MSTCISQWVTNCEHYYTDKKGPENLTQAHDVVDKALSICQHALRTSVHTTLGSSPGALAFNRDMFLNIPLVPDWHTITTQHKNVINDNLRHANSKHRRHDYMVGKKHSKYWKIRQNWLNSQKDIMR